MTLVSPRFRIVGGVNLYTYVGGNPISFVDPEGLLFTALNAFQRGTNNKGPGSDISERREARPRGRPRVHHDEPPAREAGQGELEL